LIFIFICKHHRLQDTLATWYQSIGKFIKYLDRAMALNVARSDLTEIRGPVNLYNEGIITHPNQGMTPANYWLMTQVMFIPD
jgi:hypothetical protein